MRINLSTGRAIAIAALLLSVFLVMFVQIAFAVHPSGQDYLNQVNAERQAKGQRVINPQSGTGQALIQLIDNTTDYGYEALVQQNAARGSMLADPGQISIILDRAGRDENGLVDPTKQPLKNLANPNPGQCSSGIMGSLSSWSCLIRVLFAGIGSALMWLGIKIATITGMLFEFALQWGVVQFGLLLSYIKPAIEVGWKAMRDIGNIVIIGMFVFIAINIILGVADFGDKKKIARVLIIAVLINFSLLFAEAIIDSSNFVAYQFYGSMISSIDSNATTKAATDAPGVSTDAAKSATNPTENLGGTGGIAGYFMRLLGVQGIGDSYDLLRKIQEGNQDALLGLGYGLLAFVFLLMVSFVFIYGAFLLTTRALLLIFVMLTSAIAFASWLIPHDYIEGAWMKWWKALLKGAFLGPIFIALLWMTAVVSNALARNPAFAKNGSLGDLAANASSEANVLALFSFVLILGLLFISFKAASELSSGISAWAGAGSFVKGAAGTPVVAASRLGGLFARSTLGAAGGGLYKTMRERGWGAANANIFQTAAIRSARWMGQRTFDPMATKPVRDTMSKLGALDLVGADAGKGGYIGVKKRQAKEAEELARALRPSEATRDAIRNAAQEQQRQIIAGERGALDQQHAAAQHERDTAHRGGAEEEDRVRTTQQPERAQIRAQRPVAQQTLSDARQQLAEEQQRQRDMEQHYQLEMRSATQRIADAAQRATKMNELEDERASARAGFERIIQQRTQAVQTQEGAVRRLDQRVEELDREASQAGTDATRAAQQYAEAHMENIQRDRDALRDAAPERVRRAGEAAVGPYDTRQIAESGARWKPGFIYSQGIIDELSGAIREHERDENIGATIRNLMRQQQQQQGGGGNP